MGLGLKTWTDGETVVAADINGNFTLIENALVPTGIGDDSANVAAMQGMADPYPGASESLATDLQGELRRIRYQVDQIIGSGQWYTAIAGTLEDVFTNSAITFAGTKTFSDLVTFSNIVASDVDINGNLVVSGVTTIHADNTSANALIIDGRVDGISIILFRDNELSSLATIRATTDALGFGIGDGVLAISIDASDNVSMSGDLAVGGAFSVASIDVGDGAVYNLKSGVYTPDLTNGANVDSSVPYECQYMRVGNVVTVSGMVSINVTTFNTFPTYITMTLPIPSALSALEQCGGSALPNDDSLENNGAIAIFAAVVANQAAFQFTSGLSVGTDDYSFSFTYLVL
jgi:hypothetical protein